MEEQSKTETRRTYMREYKRKKYAENANIMLEKNKSYYFKRKFNLPLEDIHKYGKSFPIVCQAKHHLDELRKLYPDIFEMILAEYVPPPNTPV